MGGRSSLGDNWELWSSDGGFEEDEEEEEEEEEDGGVEENENDHDFVLPRNYGGRNSDQFKKWLSN
jgi:hypothetical protein